MNLGGVMLITGLKLKLFSVGAIVSNHIVYNSLNSSAVGVMVMG